MITNILLVLCFIVVLSAVFYDDKLNQVAVEWSVDTLRINVRANREQWRACKRFRRCDETHEVPKWPVIEVKEYQFDV